MLDNSRELELKQLAIAIMRAETEIVRIENVLANMRAKQISRCHEMIRQQEVLTCPQPTPPT